MQEPQMILIAGPYRSGTGEDPALPVLRSVGAAGPLDPLAEQITYPTAERLLARCDAVLRLPGASTGANQDVAIARRRGIPSASVSTTVPIAPAGDRPESTLSSTRSRIWCGRTALSGLSQSVMGRLPRLRSREAVCRVRPSVS